MSELIRLVGIASKPKNMVKRTDVVKTHFDGK
jgi:hypothetical protein